MRVRRRRVYNWAAPRAEERLETLELARRAAEAASEKMAEDVLLLDLRGACDFADYFVLCSASSEPQMTAVREAVEHALEGDGARLLHAEGEAASGWVLLDFGAVVVHVFSPQEREHYRLEELWHEAMPLLRIQ